jgi:hypothetical protein
LRGFCGEAGTTRPNRLSHGLAVKIVRPADGERRWPHCQDH